MKTSVPLLFAFLIFFALPEFPQNLAMQVDGVDDYLQVPSSSIISFNGPFTICAWYYYTAGFSGEPGLVQKDGESSWGRYGIWIYLNRVDFCITPNGPQQCLFPAFTLNENTWNHIAVTFDYLQMEVYINGISVATQPFNFPPSTSDLSLYIGADPTENLYLTGKIDEVTLWNRVLHPYNIQAFLHGTVPPTYYMTPDSGIAAYYKFDQFENLGVEGDGTDDIRDYGPYANHGDTHGSPLLVDAGWITSVEDNNYPCRFELWQNYPNPFNPDTRIKYSLAADAFVKIKIYDVLGNEIKTLFEGLQTSGMHEAIFNSGNLSSGIYFYSIETNEFRKNMKMILLK